MKILSAMPQLSITLSILLVLSGCTGELGSGSKLSSSSSSRNSSTSSGGSPFIFPGNCEDGEVELPNGACVSILSAPNSAVIINSGSPNGSGEYSGDSGTPTLRISGGHLFPNVDVKIYNVNSSGCGSAPLYNLVSSGTSMDFSYPLSQAFDLGESKIIYINVKLSYDDLESTCFTRSITYRRNLVLPQPTLSINSPSPSAAVTPYTGPGESRKANSATPTIQVSASGLPSGVTAKLFSNSACTAALVSTDSPIASSANVSSVNIPLTTAIGNNLSVDIYAQLSKGTVKSPCSNLLKYLNEPAYVAPALTKPTIAIVAGTSTLSPTPSFTIGHAGAAATDTISLHSQAGCNLAQISENVTPTLAATSTVIQVSSRLPGPNNIYAKHTREGSSTCSDLLVYTRTIDLINIPQVANMAVGAADSTSGAATLSGTASNIKLYVGAIGLALSASNPQDRVSVHKNDNTCGSNSLVASRDILAGDELPLVFPISNITGIGEHKFYAKVTRGTVNTCSSVYATYTVTDGFAVDPSSPRVSAGARPAAGTSCATQSRTDLSNKQFCWGRNTEYQGGRGAGLTDDVDIPEVISMDGDFVSIGVGNQHGCGLKADGTILCWGQNDHRQLGIGSELGTTAVETYPSRPIVSTERFKYLSVGLNHSCAITESGLGYCWVLFVFLENCLFL